MKGQWHGGKGPESRISNYAQYNETASKLYPEKKSAYGWAKEIFQTDLEKFMMDPDGWRHNDGVRLETRITKEDFVNRLSECTCLHGNLGQYNLFLDDKRQPKYAYCSDTARPVSEAAGCQEDDWLIVRSFENFSLVLNYFGMPRFVSFDHDLCDLAMAECIKNWDTGQKFDYNLKGMEKTGAHCAQLLRDWCSFAGARIPAYVCHTANKEGGENIHAILAGETTMTQLLK